MKLCALSGVVCTTVPLGSRTTIETEPLVIVFSVQVTFTVSVVLLPCVTGLGEAVAVAVNKGSLDDGVAEASLDGPLVPMLLTALTS